MKKTAKFILGLTLALVCLLALQTAVSADAAARETACETVLPSADALPNADTLLAGYFENQLYGIEDVACFGRPASASLNEVEARIYHEVVGYAKEVAAGARSSTTFTITSDISELSWTAEELGTSIMAGGSLRQEAKNAMQERFSAAFRSDVFMDVLLADHPYEFYWYDKTVGMSLAYSYSFSIQRISIARIELRFYVASEYAAGDLQTDITKTSAASGAAANARSIVASHADKTDLAKLEAYRDEICALVSYNNQATGGSVSYGNPWQVIYVFDGDSSTNVVCEGYAKAFKYLCDLSEFSADVYCYLASGIMTSDSTSGGHMWNVVEIGGQNYLVDVTNVDGNSVGKGNKLFLAGAASSNGGQTHTVSWNTPLFPFGSSQTNVVYTYYEDEADLFCDGYLIISPSSYTESSQPSYTVTVTGGEGSGSYTAGETVTLIASPAPDGQVFDRWVVESGNVTLADETAATTTFTMPEGNVIVKATYVPLHTHDYNTGWSSDDSAHWHECACGDKTDLAAHGFVWVTDKEATEDEAGIRHEACTVCGMTRSENTSIPTLAHTHAMQTIPATESTCTTAGNNAYYLCTKCGRYYADPNGVNATTPNEQSRPLAAHEYDPEWKHSLNAHWKECACGDRGEMAGHTHEKTSSTSPTCTATGENVYTCVCGHSYTERVPAPGHGYISRIIKQPTVAATGIREYICSYCGHTYTEEIPKLDPPETEPEVTTAEPEVTTTEPEVTTAEPEVTTTEPEVTTAEPEVTTAEPEMTTTEPEVTTTEPEETTTEPEVTTPEPVVTTAEPEVTTAEPEVTTAEPEMTTTEPEVSTTEPEETTTEPEVTTTEPEVTTAEPEVTTAEPEVTTTEPEVTTAEPEVTTTEPEVTTTEPEVTTELDESSLEPEVTTAESETTTAEPESVVLETIDLSDLLDVGCSSAVSTPAILVLLLSLGMGYMLCRRRDEA